MRRMKKWYKYNQYHHIKFRRKDANLLAFDTAQHQKPCKEIGKNNHQSIQNDLQPIKIFLIQANTLMTLLEMPLTRD